MKLFKRLLLISVIAVVSVVLLVGAAAFVSHSVAWRFAVLKAKLSGKIPEIPLPLLFKWLRPDSPTNLRHLAVVPNVNSGVLNPYVGPNPAEAGARIYRQTCAECHGDNARGRTGPDLLASMGHMTDWTFFATVKWGRPKTIMVAQPLSDLEIWKIRFFPQAVLY